MTTSVAVLRAQAQTIVNDQAKSRLQPRLHVRRLIVAGITWAIFLMIASGTPVAGAEPSRATSSRAAREDAIHSIPFDQLDGASHEKVKAVLSATSIYRRMPIQVIRCDAHLYRFMLQNPDVTVNLWEVLGVSQVSLRRTGERTFRADDGQGTQADIEFLYSSDDTQVVFASGRYEGPLFHKPVQGSCVLLLKSGFTQQPDGSTYITSRLDTFIRLNHVGVELIAKTFQPLVGKGADYNFLETTAFLSSLSRTAEVNPASTLELAAKLKHVRAEEQQALMYLLADIGEQASIRRANFASAELPVTEPARPLRMLQRPLEPTMRR